MGLTEIEIRKENNLKRYIAGLGSLAVAFSGGVDSTYLAKVAHDVLGDRMIAITAQSGSFPRKDTDEAVEFCRGRGIRQIVVKTNELELEGFRENPADRCYICKTGIFTQLKAKAGELGIAYVADGSNADDEGDYRPGLRALRELDVKSPLMETGLTKQEIRDLSQAHGLPTWNKPSAACLASRFAYGETITREKLAMVEQAERVLDSYGFIQVRVRIHGDNLARIEVAPAELERLLSLGSEISAKFKGIGFVYVTMDMLGYRVGSMNEVLK